MEEAGAQVVAPPFFIHRQHQAMAKKRHLSSHLPTFHSFSGSLHHHHHHHQQQQSLRNLGDSGWNPTAWDWDNGEFIAKPLDKHTPSSTDRDNNNNNNNNNNKDVASAHHFKSNSNSLDNEDNDLSLNLAGGFNSVEEPISRPNKRVRSGSPGSSSYPKCQVDNCKEDLSNAKDYHRRHKVCEVHSKATKALVANRMQRFCQQCSRFHLLSEFDEGKRSCRRRLAGHNRRRRKTQPEDVTSQLLLPGSQDTTSSDNLNIVNLLTTLAHTQGKNEAKNVNASLVPDRDQFIQILSKINSLPLPMDFAEKLSNVGPLNRKISEQPSLDQLNRLQGATSSPSTMDLLAVLSATLSSSAPDTLAMLSQRSSKGTDSEKSKLTCPALRTNPNLQEIAPLEFPALGAEKSSGCYQSHAKDSDCQIQETRPHLPLQLFSSSPEGDSPPKMSSSRRYFSSDSSNPIEERSPSSSPAGVQKLFPLQGAAQSLKSEKMLSRQVGGHSESIKNQGCILPFELFGASNGGDDRGSFQSFPHQAGYSSSSGSDHSPSSQNSDTQDRTGRIIFKLFDKDPSHFPGTLRTQIYNWLANSPSEMESYIRPGCVVLSIYLSMPSTVWAQLERNLLQHVHSLVQDSDCHFWKSGRFLLHAGRQLASHRDGKIRLCKSWRTWSSPELISVSPLAVVGGQETSLLLRGRNLTTPGTKIHCTYMGGYTSKEITGSTYQRTMYDEINMGGFKIHGESPTVLGRCFIEVENGFKGNSFPVIIADAIICKELRVLESEFEDTKVCDTILEEQVQDMGLPRSREAALHFLNELGWLFQKKRSLSMVGVLDYSLSRFKFLLLFSVERDYCALVKIILDMLVERNSDGGVVSKDSLETLMEIQLLNRAVKRRCRKMVNVLINYSALCGDGLSKRYIFPPNSAGPGGITPLHLAACTTGSEDLVDALTNDPQEIGLSCWNSLLDSNGQSPYSYAIMTNNHSYNSLVARKLADRRSDQVSLTIGGEVERPQLAMEQELSGGSHLLQGHRSCATCATLATKYSRRVRSTQGLLQHPYIHSILAVAAVCVVVCLFYRGPPYIRSELFQWEALEFGTG